MPCAQLRARWFRKKLLDSQDLLHSEWNRRLGAFSLTGVGGIITLATSLFVVLPLVFSSGSSVPPLISLAITMFVHFVAASQLSSIARILPRNCLLYQLAYTINSELLAFFIAWSQLVDAVAFCAVLAGSFTSHVNLLFNSAVSNASPTPTIHVDMGEIFTVCSLAAAGMIMCCSLRVLATMCVVFLASSVFTVTSTTVVALLHNLQQLRITTLIVPLHYDQVVDEVHFYLLLVLCVELFSHVPEETEQPRKGLPRAFILLAQVCGCVTAVAAVIFFPFTQRLFFHARILLPNVFGAIGIYSARYLLSVGAVCAFAGGLMVSLLPPSRIICTLTRDMLLPLPQAVTNLSGKGGAPRAAVALSTIAAIGCVFVPRQWLLAILATDTAIRLFCQSILIFYLSFSPTDILVLSRAATKYSRLRASPLGSSTGGGAGDDGYSYISSDEECDPDDEVISHLCQLHTRQNAAWTSTLDTVATSYQNPSTQTVANTNHPRHHDCIDGSCADYQIKANLDNRFHIYEADFENSPFSSRRTDGLQAEPFAHPELALQKALRYLFAFIGCSLLIAVAHRVIREAHSFVPLLAAVVVAVCCVMLVFFAIQTHRLRCKAEDQPTSKWMTILCLGVVFITSQLLVTFSIVQLGFFVLQLFVGFVVYSIALCTRG